MGGPEFTDATVALAHLEMRKGNRAKAVQILKNAPHNSQGSLFNTWASVEAKAVSHCTTEHTPACIPFLVARLAASWLSGGVCPLCWVVQGNMEVATQLMTEACDLFPEDFSLLQTLGTLHVSPRSLHCTPFRL